MVRIELEQHASVRNLRQVWAAVVIVLATLVVAAPAASAQPPFEPNDSLLTASGPLSNNSSYTATLETGNDIDLYYFYVTSPSTAQLNFTLTNLGGGHKFTEVDGRVTDSHGSSVRYIGEYIEPADYATTAVTLSAGKYYVEVSPHSTSAYGESYKLDVSGTDGAFGPYALIQHNCASATGPVSMYQAQLATAEARLRKVEERFRQLRYAKKRSVRKRAQAKLRHVKAVVVAEKASLKAAEAGQKPWCFIPA
jgi:hypothetical protein